MIIVDGGVRAGFGHVGRCLAVGEELGAAGAFLTPDDGVLEYLRTRGATVVNAERGTRPPRVVVLDRAMPVEPSELRRFKRAGSRVVLVDDPGPGRDLADLVVDPPTGSSWPPTAGRRLAGFEHALVRREIRDAVADRPARAEVLVSMGGSDPTHATPSLVAALTGAGVGVNAVLGPGYRGPGIDPRLQVDPSEWPTAIAGARLLVTRFGHTLLEAANLGIPAIAVPFDARDREDARAFAAYGTTRQADSDSVSAIVALVGEMLADERGLTAMARTGRRLIDGLGARRVAGVLLELAS